MTVTIEEWGCIYKRLDSIPSPSDYEMHVPEFFDEYLKVGHYRYRFPVFSKNLQSPADAPPGTEVYVDRSAATEIMPIEEIDRLVLGDYVD